jgi:hypothetical protein
MDRRPPICPGVDGRLMEIPHENVRWNCGSTRRDFREFIGSFIIMWTPRGEMKSKPVPAPIFINDPSKYMVQSSA